MTRALKWISTFVAFTSIGCVSQSVSTGGHAAAVQPDAPPCDMAAASPWIEKWLAAWDLASRQILRVPRCAAPGDRALRQLVRLHDLGRDGWRARSRERSRVALGGKGTTRFPKH